MTLEDYLSRGQQAEQRLDWAAAIDCYMHALTVSPDSQEVLEKLVWCLSRAKRYDEALAQLRRLADSQPQLAKWPYMIGYQYHEQQQWKQAIREYDRALSLKPDYIVVLYRKGYAHAQLKEVGDALRCFERCRQLWHRLPEGAPKQRDKGNCAKAAYHQAEVILENSRQIHGGTGVAVTLLQEAISLDPDDHNKHYLLGKAYLEDNQPQQALGAFEQSDRLEPDQDYVVDKWAAALMKMGRQAEAVATYQRIPPQQRKAYILRNLGQLYQRLGQTERAIETLRQAVQREPRNHYGHYYLGLAYQGQGDIQGACREYRDAVRLRDRYYHVPFPEAQSALVLRSFFHDRRAEFLVG